MASLKDIRRRISSVKNTQQITKAMKMVAASRLRKAQDMISGLRPYSDKIEELVLRLSAETLASISLMSPEKQVTETLKIHPLLRQTSLDEDSEREKLHLVVISSDKGLCGAYNTNVCKKSWATYQELKEKYDLSVSFYGRRAFDYFRKNGVHGEYHEEFWQGNFDVLKSTKVSDALIEQFYQGEIDRVVVLFTEFRSALSQEAVVKQILPLEIAQEDVEEAVHNLEKEKQEAEAKNDHRPFMFKPGRQQLLDTLLPSMVKMSVFRSFADSLASEYGARMTSMDNASNNAREMIDKLTLQANRVRQAAITTELMEITGGAEALKG